MLEAFAECFEQEDSVAELIAGEGWQSADGSIRFAMPAKKETTPHESWGGQTPYQVILAERRAIASKLAESRGS